MAAGQQLADPLLDHPVPLVPRHSPVGVQDRDLARGAFLNAHGQEVILPQGPGFGVERVIARGGLLG